MKLTSVPDKRLVRAQSSLGAPKPIYIFRKWLDGSLRNESGDCVGVTRSDLSRYDWEYVETDEEKIERLETANDRALGLCAEYIEDGRLDSYALAAVERIAEALK